MFHNRETCGEEDEPCTTAPSCNFNDVCQYGEFVFGPLPNPDFDEVICEGLVINIGISTPLKAFLNRAGIQFGDFSAWVEGYKEETLQCFKSKGYRSTEEEVGDKIVFTDYGHGFYAYFETDEIEEEVTEKVSIGSQHISQE